MAVLVLVVADGSDVGGLGTFLMGLLALDFGTTHLSMVMMVSIMVIVALYAYGDYISYGVDDDTIASLGPFLDEHKN